ncbi:MAG: phosphodiester glycosidase family protein [Deltaproteobacteria bacterium]|nr:phosphodiester glycosidase family protein [Deltaproteobacteria bacterium]
MLVSCLVTVPTLALTPETRAQKTRPGLVALDNNQTNIKRSSVVIKRTYLGTIRVAYFLATGDQLQLLSGGLLKKIILDNNKKITLIVNANYFSPTEKKSVGVLRNREGYNKIIYHKPKGRGAIAIMKDGKVRILTERQLFDLKHDVAEFSGWYLFARVGTNNWFKDLVNQNRETVANKRRGVLGLDPARRTSRILFCITKDGRLLALQIGETKRGVTLPKAIMIAKNICRQEKLAIDSIGCGDSGSAATFSEVTNESVAALDDYRIFFVVGDQPLLPATDL